MSTSASVALIPRAAPRAGASRASASRPVRAAASAVPSGDCRVAPGDAERAGLGRRGVLGATALALAGALAPAARAAEVSVVKDEPGFGSKTAKPGDLLLVVDRREEDVDAQDSPPEGLKVRQLMVILQNGRMMATLNP